jgi:putative flavoprotein involved in K+ transport
MRGSNGTDADVLIVGGGPGGLAAAAALQGAGLDSLVLERGDAIGSS